MRAGAPLSTLLCALLLALAAGCDGRFLSYGSSVDPDPGQPLGPPGVSAYGDRNRGIRVVYPDAALFQNGGPVVNLRNPPPGIRAAVGDGVTDDTAAFQDAFDFIKNAFVNHARIPYMYLPDGTYLVSDTLIYRGPTLEPLTGYDWYDIVGVRWLGESREGTVIRLKDASPGFQDPAHPKVVLAYQHPDTRFNNIAAGNQLERITFDTGRGNPGAIGVFFQGANGTTLDDVRVYSEDGAGAYGIWFPIGSVQGAYHDITVQGFQYGIYQPANSECDESMEHLTLSGQQLAGARVSGGGMTLRAASIEESSSSVPALLLDGAGGQLVVVDSQLTNSVGGIGIQLVGTGQKQLFARNTHVEGFEHSIVNGSTQLDGDVTEYVSSAPVTLFSGQPTTSFALPVLDTPQVSWFTPDQWANVDDFGAKGGDDTDDTVAIQAALDSGKPVVFLPAAGYQSKALTVPATVQRVEGFGATLQLTVQEASDQPVLFHNLNGYGGISLQGDRTVIMQDMSGGFSNDGMIAQHVFLENVANVGASLRFTVAGQRTFGRGLNDENASGLTDFYVTGGALWILNFKTENKPVSTVYAAGGALLEVLGGYTNVTRDPGDTPFVANDNSNVSYIGFTNNSCAETQVAIAETRGDTQKKAMPAQLPERGSGGGCYTIPLYVGYDAAKVKAALAALR